MRYLILILIGAVSGIISGMGIGGGTILIPALSIFLDYEQKAAQNINLIYFIPTAVIALITHVKNNNVEKKTAAKIALFGIIGAILGSLLAGSLKGAVLKKLFGGFLIIMGLTEILKKENKNNGDK